MCNTRPRVRTAPAGGWKSLSARLEKTKTINSKEPLNKLAELARAHRAEHKERCSIVQPALSSNERETCVQCRVVCRYSLKGSQNGYQWDTPSIFRLAMSTTVSLIPRSLVDFLRREISADISASFRRSSASRSGCDGSSGDAGM